MLQVFPEEELVVLLVVYPVEGVVLDNLQSLLNLRMTMTLKVPMQNLKKWKKN